MLWSYNALLSEIGKIKILYMQCSEHFSSVRCGFSFNVANTFDKWDKIRKQNKQGPLEEDIRRSIGKQHLCSI